MQILKKTKIIGFLIIIILLVWQSPEANAIYSRKLNADVRPIKNHIREARTQNGTGTLLNAWDKVNQKNKAAEERGEAYGPPGLYSSYLAGIKDSIIISTNDDEKGLSFIDSFKLYFVSMMAPFVSHTTCWRDDVWAVQALQEEVSNELLKAGLLGDSINGTLLLIDYKALNRLINDLVENYADDSWFGIGQQNYYIDCPYGAFDQAFKELQRSWKHLSVTFSGGTTGDWGSLLEMAKKNAKKKAAQWVKANKISFSLGGPAGANPRSLVKGLGLKGLQAELEVGAEYWKAYGQLVYNEKYWAIVGRGAAPFETIIRAYDTAIETRTLAENQLKNEIQFNLQLNNIAEQGLIEVEETLWFINQTILQTAEDGVMATCEKLNTLLKSFNKSKNSDLVNCSE